MSAPLKVIETFYRAAKKFTDKVERGDAVSRETYADMKKAMREADLLGVHFRAAASQPSEVPHE